MAPSCKLRLARFSARLKFQDEAKCGNKYLEVSWNFRPDPSILPNLEVIFHWRSSLLICKMWFGYLNLSLKFWYDPIIGSLDIQLFISHVVGWVDEKSGGGSAKKSTIQKIIPLRGPILQAETCQIYS